MNFTPPPNFDSISQALTTLFGSDTKIVQKNRVSGGDINDAYRLTLNDGTLLFIKTNSKNRLSMFLAEAMGLAALRQTNAIGIPHIYCTGTDDEGNGCSFLLMEYIDSKPPVPNYWEHLGHELAAVHKAPADIFVSSGKYGFDKDNYIGSSGQKNPAYNNWTDFFRDCRLLPQINRAKNYFSTALLSKMDKLLGTLEKFLIEPEKPALLHGDLWSGNVICGNDGSRMESPQMNVLSIDGTTLQEVYDIGPSAQ